MKSILSGLLTGSLLLSAAMAGETGPSTGAAAKDVPLGHKDFYPSPQRPVGFRGDGNGWFPGATPVSEFWDGTPAEVERPLITESFGKPIDTKGKTTAKVWDVTDEKSKNIVWKTRLPGWSLADPIVVGDRVFAVGEPDWLTCFDAATGKVLWQHRVLSPELDGKSPEEAARLQQVIDIAAAFEILKGQAGPSLFTGSLSSPEAVTAPMVAKLTERLPAWRKIVADADNDPGLLAAFDKAAAAVAGRGKVEGAALKQTAQQIGEFSKAVEKRYRVMVIPQWYGYNGHANATPCSDGERVYVAFGRGQVAAYDLDGRRVWGRRFDKWAGSRFSGLNLSPQLCDGVLIVKDLTNVTWHGLDAKTGKTIWSRPEIGDSQYYYQTALVVTLTAPDGKSKRVVVYPKDLSIRRATDDAVLGQLPTVAGKEGDGGNIHHLLAQGDLVWRGRHHHSEGAGFRLRLVADDRVEVTPVWENKTMRCHWPFHTGAFGIIVGQSGNLYSFATGQSVAQIKVGRGEDWQSSSYVIGNLLFGESGANNGNNTWWRGPMSYGGGQGGEGRPTDRKAMVRFKLINLADPKAPKTVSERNLLQEPGPAADIHVERFFAGLDPFLFAGTYHGSASFFGCVMGGGPVASGNRVFIQSATHLRCIGDPAVKYDWNPQNRPAHITNALKARTPSTKEP